MTFSLIDNGYNTFFKDDVYILEQQLILKQRDLTLAQEQLKQMTSLSHQVNLNEKANFH